MFKNTKFLSFHDCNFLFFKNYSKFLNIECFFLVNILAPILPKLTKRQTKCSLHYIRPYLNDYLKNSVQKSCLLFLAIKQLGYFTFIEVEVARIGYNFKNRFLDNKLPILINIFHISNRYNV